MTATHSSCPNLTLNLYTLSFVLLLAHLPPLLTSPTVPLPGSGLRSLPIYLISHFVVAQQKDLCSKGRGYLSELYQVTCLEEFHSSFCSPFSFAELLAAASNLSLSTATGPDKVAYPMLKHLPRSGMDFLLHIFNLSWSSHSFPSIWKSSSIILIHKMGKSLDFSASFSPFASQSFLNRSFYLVYSIYCSLIPLSLPARLVFTLDGLL